MAIIMGILFVSVDSLLVRCSKHGVLANAIDVDNHGQLFVATDVGSFDSVHLLLGALQEG